ncbi:hypothetical protein ACO229_11080 [Promicromonospora sp. MS192]|uniref:hypothetical protein n=1 Tax=Promicromonospora sp. MS192 TaxID=3412684 RepID=UPI003C2F712D
MSPRTAISPDSSPRLPLDGGLVTSVCRAYGQDTDGWDARPDEERGEYTAVVDHPALPGAVETVDVLVCRGAAVELDDRWVFFDDLAPAATFVDSGRASNLPSLDLYEAAEVRAHCAEHGRPEAALLLGRQVYEPSEIRGLVARYAAHVAGRP